MQTSNKNDLPKKKKDEGKRKRENEEGVRQHK